MDIDKLIYELEELRSKHKDLYVYVWDQDWGWEEFSLALFERQPNSTSPPGEEKLWVGLG